MNVEAEPKPRKMETTTPHTISDVELLDSSTRSCCTHHQARDNWRYQVALVISLAVLLGVIVYGSFATLL